jgi:hypothetical protein
MGKGIEANHYTAGEYWYGSAESERYPARLDLAITAL